jgi:hypothetical protein|tara:strand:- start:2720 stop:2869 length:150 start_codon:yes stop_codon:yes gene_type:complete
MRGETTLSPFGGAVAVLRRWIQYPLLAIIWPCIPDLPRHILRTEIPFRR